MASPKFWKRYFRPNILRLKLAATNRWPTIHSDMLQAGEADFYLDEQGKKDAARTDYAYPDRVGSLKPNQLTSCLCIESQLKSQAFRYWINRLGGEFSMHRKLWEQAYIMQALYERDMLRPGRSGLGFAVGEEPLPDFFAQQGCEIMATDLDSDDDRAKDWRDTGQHMSGRGSEDEEETSKPIKFRAVDMNRIPKDLGQYDFTWSTCSFEHCGSIQLGADFVRNQMQHLKPGGIAVHTTEFNLTSNDKTIEEGSTVIYRRRDIEELVQGLIDQGHEVEPLSLDPGSGSLDRYVDWPPYTNYKHMRLMLERYAATSIALIIRKPDAQVATKTDAA